MQCMIQLYRKRAKPIALNFLDHKRLGLCRQLKFTKPIFNSNFPPTGSAKVQDIFGIANDLADRFRELWIVIDPPEKRVRIDENTHALWTLEDIEDVVR